EETIRSVLMQGYPNLEYIVLDGCSTDNTSSILNRYRDEITHCVIEPDRGQSDALNKGFKLATGEILAWLNSDDCYLPETLYRVAIAFDLYKADMLAGGCQLREGFSRTIFRTHHTALPLGEVVPLPLDRLLDLDHCWQKGEFFYQPEVFWTRELWQRTGGKVDDKLFYSMDYELWVRMAYHNAQAIHIPDSITLFRLHEKQKTYGDEIPFLPELRSVCEYYQQKIHE
ncbi:MAG: glycosyltransferase, partial [Merismopedia sp. SIO2A8]|nr:glycosyltransferase [Merismopedia sp. SIO2A8]